MLLTCECLVSFRCYLYISQYYWLSVLNSLSFSVREKKRINAALPAGVTEKDVQLFTRSQDKAKAFLTEENKGLDDEGSPTNGGPPPPPRTPISAGTPGKFDFFI